MRIRNQFIISMAIFSVVLLIVAGSVIVMNQQIAQLGQQQEISGNIEREADELNTLSSQYFLYQQTQQLALWQSNITSISGNLSKLNFTDLERQTLVNKARGDLGQLNASFTELVSFLEIAPRNVSVRVMPEFQNVWNGLVTEHQTFGLDASQLSESLRTQADQLRLTNIVLIIALLGIFGAFFLTNYLITYRRTLKSISNLQAGINIIGSGNLDYSIQTKKEDEISELSQAFNQMTANLKTVTTSKTVLEQEIIRRKQAETSMRESEQRWATTLASIGDAVIATDVSGRVRFMNAVAEELTGWTFSEAWQKPVKTVFNIINEQTRFEVENPVDRVLREGMVVGLANHTVLIRKDGAEVPIDDSGAPIRDKEGNASGVVLVFRDITERKKAEDELLGSERRLNRSQEIAHLGSWELDLVKNKLSWSDEVYRIFGLKPQEFGATYEAFLQAVYPDDREAVDAAYSGSLREGRDTYEIEHRVVRKSTGEIRIVYEKSEHIRDGTGKIIRSIGMVQDITERKQMQSKLEEYSRNLEKLVEERTKKLELSSLYARNLIEASLDPLVTISVEGKITDVNKATELVTGCLREQMIGSDFADYFTQPEKARQGYEEVFTKGFVKDYPLAIRHKSGRITDVLYNATVYRNEAGKISGIFAAARDVTEHRKAEEILRKQAALIDLSPDGIVVKKPDGTITFWSLGAEKLYGWTAAQAVGQKIQALLKTKFPEPSENINSQLEQEGKWSGELTHQTKLGRAVAIQSYWLAKFGESGGMAEIFESNVDITERKDAERLAAIGQTAGMVGHDIRNPLQSILGELYLAKDEVTSLANSSAKENLNESIGAIEENIIYINKIVADLQDFAKPLNPVVEESDLESIINDLLLQHEIPKNLQVDSKVSRNARMVMADSAYLKRILGNLISNAVQAMPNGGKLSIEVCREADDAVITVKDSGIGIPEEVKPKLFQPLFTTKSKGQGFGLAVVKRMIEALNGTVTFKSEVGKGTKFIIRLPKR